MNLPEKKTRQIGTWLDKWGGILMVAVFITIMAFLPFIVRWFK